MARGPHIYRSDIDGLRAVAVLAVVLFHAYVPGFSGGFVGVDVFFVISGFLITSIILEDMEAGRFSIAQFYDRRIRRIFPALFTVLAASTVAAAFLLLPPDFKEFGESLAAATAFVSNVFFWRTSDYFAGPAHLKPLLHTWSLAVEEQFYIFYPVLLLLVRRWSRWAIIALLSVALAVSFGLSVWGAAERPVVTFYLAPFRAWELLLGALLALGALPQASNRVLCDLLGLGGLVLILWSVTTYSTATEFPGVNALAPCVGTALVIYSGQSASTFVRQVLSLRSVVFVGLISYSLYLWHWPMLVFMRHWNGEILSAGQTTTVLAASVALAALSWRYVEQPFRSRAFRIERTELFRAAGAVMASAIAFGLLAHLTNGWTRRFEGYDRPAIVGLEKLRDKTCFLLVDQAPWNYAGLEECRSGAAEAPMILVWGDSFAAHLVPGLQAVAGDATGVLQYTASGCPPVLGMSFANRPYCRAFNDHVLSVIAEVEPEVVLMSARWEMHMPRNVKLADVQATVHAINAMGVKVILAGQSPTFDFAHPYDFTFRKGIVPARVSFDTRINAALATVSGAMFFDSLPLLCKREACPLREEDDFLYFDGGHFSFAGSQRIGKAILDVIAPMLPVAEPEPPPAASAAPAPASGESPPGSTPTAPAPPAAPPAEAAPQAVAPAAAGPPAN